MTTAIIIITDSSKHKENIEANYNLNFANDAHKRCTPDFKRVGGYTEL